MQLKPTDLSTAFKVQQEPEAFKMYSSAELDVIHLYLHPGESIPLHSNNLIVVFCILQGKGRLIAGEETLILNTYNVVEVPACIERSMSNPFDEDLRILVLKKLITST